LTREDRIHELWDALRTEWVPPTPVPGFQIIEGYTQTGQIALRVVRDGVLVEERRFE
jgi:hypothetical protein